MSEAKSNSKGHAYGRRNLQLSNTAEAGELCIYAGHGVSKFSDKSMRYDSHQACTRCVAAAREGRISFDINRLMRKHRKRALKFWSQVDIGAPDDCWNWNGCINNKSGQPQFAWRRHGISSSTQHHPQRVAMWFTWGDLGYTGVKTTCGNKYCCNPFHLIPQNIGVFVDDESYIESFELAVQIHTLKQQVAEYVMEEAIKEEERKLGSEERVRRSSIYFDNDANFEDRLHSVIADMIDGNHVSQIDATNILMDVLDNEMDIEPPDTPQK
tara:strand:- start:6665 stop:7471 length:807 start_codon:yes stop_codon:yes gene_type:complete